MSSSSWSDRLQVVVTNGVTYEKTENPSMPTTKIINPKTAGIESTLARATSTTAWAASAPQVNSLRIFKMMKIENHKPRMKSKRNKRMIGVYA